MVQSSEEFAKAFKLQKQVAEYVLILKNLAGFKKIEKNHFYINKTVKTRVSMLASVMKVVNEHPVDPEEW